MLQTENKRFKKTIEEIEAYLADLKKFIKWYQETAGELPEAASVGPLDIAEFKRHLQNRGYKPVAVNRIRVTQQIIPFSKSQNNYTQERVITCIKNQIKQSTP